MNIEFRLSWLSWHLMLCLSMMVGCQVEGGSQSSFITYMSDAADVSFEHPQDWIVRETEGEILAVSSEALIAGDRYDGGATVTIIRGPSGGFQGSPLTLLSELVALVSTPERSELANQAAEVKINGQNAAMTSWISRDGDTEVVITAAVIATNAQVLYLITIFDRAVEAEFGSVVDRLTNSISLKVVN